MILKITPNVNPTIANGKSNSQTNIKIKNRPIARGQHKVNKIQNSNTAINSFMATIFLNELDQISNQIL
jgi:hypothetical protein